MDFCCLVLKFCNAIELFSINMLLIQYFIYTLIFPHMSVSCITSKWKIVLRRSLYLPVCRWQVSVFLNWVQLTLRFVISIFCTISPSLWVNYLFRNKIWLWVVFVLFLEPVFLIKIIWSFILVRVHILWRALNKCWICLIHWHHMRLGICLRSSISPIPFSFINLQTYLWLIGDFTTGFNL